jgi:tRNA-2-methylthio-N6-dimethylallyladenosine synthase
MTGRSFFIHTFGCQMNERDTEIMAGLLTRRGFVPAPSLEEAQVALVNTCHIREHAEQKAMSLLGRLKAWREADPGRVLALTGCVAEARGKALTARYPFLDVVLGPASVRQLPDLVERVRDGEGPLVATGHADARDVPELTDEHPAGHRAWVKIMEGCDHACAFCVVPAVRGRERNRPFEEIVAEVTSLAARGVVEVTLLGQTVNAWGKTAGPGRDFAGLLRALDAVPGLERLRFTSPHPAYHTGRVLEAMAEGRTVCEHLHLPVQSGSDRVLREMKRGYTAARWLEIVARARALMPELAVTTDVIVGFPGETEEDFDATMAMLRAADVHAAYTFKYSARPGTPAATREDQVSEEAKDARLTRLNAFLEAQGRGHHDALVGRRLEVLVDGSREDGRGWQGRLRTNTPVTFAPDGRVAPGARRQVEIVTAGSWTLEGRLVPAGAPVPA